LSWSDHASIQSLPVVDPDMRAELVEAVGLEALADLTAPFVQSAREQADAITAALADGSRERLRRAGHTLKGLAGNFGATRLAALGLAIEQARDDPAEAARLAAFLDAEIGLVGDAMSRA
jgi:HPt (histidine-containing phosphotransfer) domain-containing protein